MRRLVLGGRRLLFSGRRQQVFELNPTADLIWTGLAAGRQAREVVGALRDLGAEAATAAAFVREAAKAWMSAGHLVPEAVRAALQAPPAAVRTLALDELVVEIGFHGWADWQACDAVFGQLYGHGRPTQRLQLVGHDELVFLVRAGEPIGAAAPADAPAQLKALLTELYVEAVADGFLAHGALLDRGDRRLFLSGAPGAGKTTLTVALASSGWAYGGDDIVRINGRGGVRGAPFSAAVKSGAWALAERFAPEIARLPTSLRSDGQAVRYWRPHALAERRPRPLSAVVLLAREAGAPARLEPIEPVAALHAILESAYSARWRLDGEALAALAATLEAATCARLVYEDLGEAVAALEALA